MFNPQTLHARLLQNKEYKQRFIDRAYKHFENDGVFTPDAAQARFEARVAQIDMAIIAESARWGDAQSGSAYTKDNAWLPEIERVYDQFFPYRTDIVIDHNFGTRNLNIQVFNIVGGEVDLKYPTYPNMEFPSDNQIKLFLSEPRRVHVVVSK